MKQEIVSEINGLNYLDNWLHLKKLKRLFIVTGKSSFKLSGASEKLKLVFMKYECSYFSSFSTNPKYEEAISGIELYKKSNADVVIAIGGGSVIDMAKSIQFLATQKGNLKDRIIKTEFDDIASNVPLVTIPTTAGTGSESTKFAVIYIDQTKYSIEHESILPNLAIIDSSLHVSLPQYMAACAGADALCQCMESIWSINSNNYSTSMAIEALRLIKDYLKPAILNKDINSLQRLAYAANLAGQAINITKTTAAHSVSYPITSYFNVPHGHAVALTILKFLKFNYEVGFSDCNDPRGPYYVKKSIQYIVDIFGNGNIELAESKIKQLLTKIGLELSFAKLGIKEDRDFEIIVSKGYTPNRMKNNPRKVATKDILSVLINND
jgi:alcohol dehydrogenase